jgi:hypothetical protein
MLVIVLVSAGSIGAEKSFGRIYDASFCTILLVAISCCRVYGSAFLSYSYSEIFDFGIFVLPNPFVFLVVIGSS